MPPAHAQPATVEAPPILHRVARTEFALEFSEISSEDVAEDRAGNRFDVPGGGILYCASAEEGCFAETLSRFRPSAAVRSALAEVDPEFMIVGGVPADWRHRRLVVHVAAVNALPFLDVENCATHEYLTTALAGQIAAMQVQQIDVAAVRGTSRRLTRAISTWAYNATDDDGDPLYSGIRYVSRLGDYECWAVFEGTMLEEVGRDLITPETTALKTVADKWGLRVF